MPTPNTFECEPIKEFVFRYLRKSIYSVDPFARNSTLCTYRNDRNPETAAPFHMDAQEFLLWLASNHVRSDLLVLDPPYSPRQVSECYQEAGIDCSTQETQNGGLYKRVRDAALPLLLPEAVVLSFGWNSTGMSSADWEIIELMLVCHGGAHNDTICLAQQRKTCAQRSLL